MIPSVQTFFIFYGVAFDIRIEIKGIQIISIALPSTIFRTKAVSELLLSSNWLAWRPRMVTLSKGVRLASLTLLKSPSASTSQSNRISLPLTFNQIHNSTTIVKYKVIKQLYNNNINNIIKSTTILLLSNNNDNNDNCNNKQQQMHHHQQQQQ